MKKLHNKDFSIAVKTGIEANKSKFAKEAFKGEAFVLFFFTPLIAAMAGNVAGRPNFQSLMDTRARQMTEAKLDKATGGSTVVVDAKSTNVVNSNSTSSATFTNTSTRNPNLAVAALNYSY